MRFRLLRRRLTISAPRMAVRSAMPWPLRWAVAAIVLGFCAAIGLWAFEFGKDIAGLERFDREELPRLRQEVRQLRNELEQARSVANTSHSVLTASQATQDQLGQQIKALEAENRDLRNDLGFFEKLIPAGTADGVSIRSLQVERVGGHQLRWLVLLIQSQKNPAPFSGRVTLTLNGQLQGKPWTLTPADAAKDVQFTQYRRLEGITDIPPQAVIQAATATLSQGDVVRAIQTVKP
jgi:hypothetical protein